jgi:hypothetical protein
VGACSATFYCSAYTRGLNRFTHGMSMCASAGLVDHETEWVKVRVSDDAQPTHRTVTPLPGAGVDSPFRAENLLTYRVDSPRGDRAHQIENSRFARVALAASSRVQWSSSTCTDVHVYESSLGASLMLDLDAILTSRSEFLKKDALDANPSASPSTRVDSAVSMARTSYRRPLATRARARPSTWQRPWERRCPIATISSRAASLPATPTGRRATATDLEARRPSFSAASVLPKRARRPSGTFGVSSRDKQGREAKQPTAG